MTGQQVFHRSPRSFRATPGVFQARTAWIRAGRTREAEAATAFAIALLGYLTGSIFLHLSYPRYFWLLLGIAYGLRGIAPVHAAQAAATRQPALVGSEVRG